MDLWQIVIFCDNGPTYTILGDEDILKAELTAWQAYQERELREAQEAIDQYDESPYVDAAGYQVREIQGISASAHSPTILGYRFNEVQAMQIMRVR